MITLKELLQGTPVGSLSPETALNLQVLLERINVIRKAYNKPMTVSSGLRSMKHHLEVYRKKGITDPAKIPMKSKHLFGQAVDIADPKQELQKWVLANVKLLETAQLWCEDFGATPAWVHFQTQPPRSGKRFFMP